jgi:hypothetical protein
MTAVLISVDLPEYPCEYFGCNSDSSCHHAPTRRLYPALPSLVANTTNHSSHQLIVALGSQRETNDKVYIRNKINEQTWI